MIEHALRYAALGWHVFPVWWIVDGACACGDASCTSPGKHPTTRNGLSEATSDAARVTTWWTETPAASIGVVMAPSGLCALDVDIYHDDLTKIATLEQSLGPLPLTVVQQSGSGEGMHFIFRAPPHEVRGVVGGVVVRARAYIIVAPSTHKSGNTYAWEPGMGPGEVEVAEFPAAWQEALKKVAQVGEAGVPSADSEPAWLRAVPDEQRVADMRAHLTREPGEVKGQSRPGMSFDVARSAARAYAVRDPQVVLDAMLEIYDPKCVPPWGHRLGRHVYTAYNRAHAPAWGSHYVPAESRLDNLGLAELAAALPDPPRTTALDLIAELQASRDRLRRSSNPKKKRDGMLLSRILRGDSLADKPEDEDPQLAMRVLAQWSPRGATDVQLAERLMVSCRGMSAEELVAGIAAARLLPRETAVVRDQSLLPPPATDDELRSQLRPGKEEGSVAASGPNISRVIRYARDLRGRLRFNLLTKDIEVDTGFFFETPKGVLDVAIANWLSERWNINASTSVVAEQISLVARTTGAYNPVAMYLEALAWDGVRRLDEWLIKYCGAQDTPYNRRIAAMWMIAACARGVSPGCKVDNVLVLEGIQGSRKSSTFAALGDPWFSGTPLVLGNKDSYQITSSTWIIELAELSSLRAGEVEAHKAFLSAASDKYRPPYGKVPESFDRHCVFGGSTNELEYMQDSTGNRRFWAVRVADTIDVDGIRRDRDQLWAEAHHRYLHADVTPDRADPACPGERWWMSQAEEVEAAVVIAERRAEDPWVGLILEWLGRQSMPGPGVASPRKIHTLAEVAKGALSLEISDLPRYQRQVARSMREAGMESTGETVRGEDGRRVRYWRLSRDLHGAVSDPPQVVAPVELTDN